MPADPDERFICDLAAVAEVHAARPMHLEMQETVSSGDVFAQHTQRTS